MSVFPPPPCCPTLLAILLASSATAVHAAQEEKPEPSTEILADQSSVREGDFAEARGNVTVIRDSLKIGSDWVHYEIATDKISAGDKVTLVKDGDTLTGSQLNMTVNAREGDLLDPAFQMKRGAIRGDAVKLIFDGPERYQIKNARLTTCEPGRDDWYIHSGNLQLDYTKNIGEAWNGWVEFQGTPIFYYPWIDFPLDGNRKSGVLPPWIGMSSRNGFQLQTPVYYNIAPNYDATFYPRYMSKSGVMLGGEFRYLEESFTGKLRADTIDDQITNTRRNSVSWQHKQQFSKELSLEVNAQKVTDNEYLADFGDRLAVTSQSNLPREGKLSYSGENWSTMLRWQRYQTLTTPSNPVDKPYDRIPQLYFTAQPQMKYGLLSSVSGELTDFSHPDKTSGVRSWVYPNISIPFNESWGFIIPKIGVHATHYQLDANGGTPAENYSRVLPIASIDSGLYFERETRWFGTDVAQTLEPRAYYLRVPYRDQTKLPVFDSGETDLSLTQLFSENQFSGQDRINDANQLTLAMTSRVFESSNGIERFSITVGQRLYFTNQQVTLTSPGRAESVRRSDWLMTTGARFLSELEASYAMQYNQQDNTLRRADWGITWKPGDFKTLNLRYVNNRIADTRQFDISGQWPIFKGWNALGRFNYSIADRRAQETLAGLEYNAGCWAFRLAGQRYATSTSDYNTNFYALLELGGVAGLGSNPVDTIRQSIPGYANTYTPPRF